jgi:DNA-binding winged helix-turn-helix (wHTH) protein/TolB-like protein/cytochrome c-type biogenesis protein CcmH/NrfG
MPLTIGDWAVDAATNELSRGATTTRVEPKVMDVLSLLADRAGSVVSREEFFARVWPGLVVGDEALSQSITKLRRALGDDPQSPAYIETIAKRGYRLKAPVRRELPAVESARPPRGGRWPWALAAFAVLAVLAIGAAYLAARSPGSAGTAPAASTAGDERDASYVTVTVLPFESLGGDGSQAYFARGIGDNLMTDLAGLSGLRVIAANGPAHAARYVVSGSVQRDAGGLRINVHLVDSRTGEQLWSERFERPVADLFTVQDEIAGKLARSLPAKVSEAERGHLAKRYTRSLDAYDLFLHAQALFLARGARENREARALYQQAVATDPRFARAYAGLAMTYAIDHRLRGGAALPDDLARARAFAESARQIDPDIAEVYWALGFVQVQERHHTQAIASLERAVALNPSFADAYALMAGVRTYMGEPAKSIPLLRTAMRLKPDGGYLYYLLLGRAYLFEGDGEQALINLKEAIARNPADLESHVYLAAATAAAGDGAAAEWEVQEVRALDRNFSVKGWLAGYPLSSAPHRARLEALLAKAGLP